MKAVKCIGETDCWGQSAQKLTFITVVSSVKWMPPEGSLPGKSNEWIVTPFFRLLNPFRVTVFPGKEISETVIP